MYLENVLNKFDGQDHWSKVKVGRLKTWVLNFQIALTYDAMTSWCHVTSQCGIMHYTGEERLRATTWQNASFLWSFNCVCYRVGTSSVVERSLIIREAPGSIPGPVKCPHPNPSSWKVVGVTPGRQLAISTYLWVTGPSDETWTNKPKSPTHGV